MIFKSPYVRFGFIYNCFAHNCNMTHLESYHNTNYHLSSL